MITIQNIQKIVGSSPIRHFKITRIDENNDNYTIEIKRVVFDPKNIQPFSLLLKLNRTTDESGRISLVHPQSNIEMLLKPDHIKDSNDFITLLKDLIEAQLD